MVKRYSLVKIGDNQYQLTKNRALKGGMIYTDKEVGERTVDLLNELEDTRLQQKSKIVKYKEREERYQRVLSGFKAFVELEANNDLWYDWND